MDDMGSALLPTLRGEPSTITITKNSHVCFLALHPDPDDAPPPPNVHNRSNPKHPNQLHHKPNQRPLAPHIRYTLNITRMSPFRNYQTNITTFILGIWFPSVHFGCVGCRFHIRMWDVVCCERGEERGGECCWWGVSECCAGERFRVLGVVRFVFRVVDALVKSLERRLDWLFRLVFTMQLCFLILQMDMTAQLPHSMHSERPNGRHSHSP